MDIHWILEYKSIISNEIINEFIKVSVEGGNILNKGLATLIYSKRLVKREVYLDFKE